MTFDARSTTDEVLAGHDLSGRTYVVTGATAGLGLETARALAAAGATVVVGGRDDARGAAAVARVGGDSSHLHLDLADLDDVRAAARSLVDRLDRLDGLVNNAGVMACPLRRTADGFELQFGTNHLGHFLLTARLMPLLLASAPARVVNLSSQGHQIASVDLTDPNYEHRPYDNWEAYGQSKTANIWFTRALERRFGQRGVHAFAVHPGMVATDLGRHLTPADVEAVVERARSRPAGGPSTAMKQVDTGAATQLWAATHPALADHGGAYLADVAVSDALADHALDDAGGEALWALSEQLVGEPFAP